MEFIRRTNSLRALTYKKKGISTLTKKSSKYGNVYLTSNSQYKKNGYRSLNKLLFITKNS